MIEEKSSSPEFGEYLVMPKNFAFVMSRTLRRKLTHSPQWILDLGIYNRQNCKEIFLHAIEVKAKNIYLGYNLNSAIPYDIKETPFTQLKELWFSQNQVQSIEMLCRMKTPLLEEIWFRENVINSVKSFRKAFWPNLKQISLYGNKIGDIEYMRQILCPKIHTISIEYENDDKVQGEDLSWVAKLETSVLQNLCIGSQFRIEQPKVYSAFKKKFNKKELQFFNIQE